jgi:hypothetical protein
MDPVTIAVVFAAALAVIGAAVGLMAIGQRLTGRCLRGSCGGAGACPTSPNRARDGPRRDRMDQSATESPRRRAPAAIGES